MDRAPPGSAYVLALGKRTGVRRVSAPSSQATSSKARQNMAAPARCPSPGSLLAAVPGPAVAAPVVGVTVAETHTPSR